VSKACRLTQQATKLPLKSHDDVETMGGFFEVVGYSGQACERVPDHSGLKRKA
jgi:hypothetical protein